MQAKKKRKQVHQKGFVVGTCCCKKLQVGMCVIVGTLLVGFVLLLELL
jgi:hypothetical protein